MLANESVDAVAVYAQRTISSFKVEDEGRVGDKRHATTTEYISNTVDRGVSMIHEVVFVLKEAIAIATIVVVWASTPVLLLTIIGQEVLSATEMVIGRVLLVLVERPHGSEGAIATVAVGHATRKVVLQRVVRGGYLGRKYGKIDHIQ